MSTRHVDRSPSTTAGEPAVDVLTALATAARDRKPVTGWTHSFYRYPARFSPRFARAAITHFSAPGDVVLDPYMGGGTTVVEGVVAGRRMIGNDLNALAVFIAKAKVTGLSAADVAAVQQWATTEVPTFGFRRDSGELDAFIDPVKTKNLSLAKARFIKKAVAAALASVAELNSPAARDFTRCIILRVAQWALDGRVRHTSLEEFRQKLVAAAEEMLRSIADFNEVARRSGGSAVILNEDSAMLDRSSVFQRRANCASLVVTSPPYPGVHVLYHRWQVDGRRETPAPYWIAGCNDGQGASFYNFGDRREAAADNYFRNSLVTLEAIRRVMKNGGCMIQMVAFNRPEEQLPRYLSNMEAAGFEEWTANSIDRIWREVPNRKWHATLRGKTHSANEVVLVHRAI